MSETWYKILFKDNEASAHSAFKEELMMTLFKNSTREFYLNNFIKVYEREENKYLNTYYCFPPVFHDLCATLIAKYKGVPFLRQELDSDIELKDCKFAWK